MDYHRHSICTVAARLFGREYKPKISAHRQLDSHSDCYCRHTGHIETAGSGVTVSMSRQPVCQVRTRLSQKAGGQGTEQSGLVGMDGLFDGDDTVVQLT